MHLLTRLDDPARKEEAIRAGERDDTSREGNRHRDRHCVVRHGKMMDIKHVYGCAVVYLNNHLTSFHCFILSIVHDTPLLDIHAAFGKSFVISQK
jgi:hypothetical protein